jgi:hypothetical protein
MRTLSITDIDGNSATFWNVRATPRRITRCGRVRRSDSPSKRMSPESGVYKRVTTLKTVVFPAPFGPISPTISPGCTSNETPSRATTPPNRRVTFSTTRRGAATVGGSYAARAAQR